MNITFWTWVHGRRYATPVTEVAECLDVSPAQIHEAFREWDLAGRPEETHLKVEEKRFLHVTVCYSDDYQGWLGLERPWGDHWRGLGYPSYNFTMEVTVSEGEG